MHSEYDTLKDRAALDNECRKGIMGDIKMQTGFEYLANDWWDEEGPIAPLHRMNPARIAYIREQICKHFNVDNLQGLNVLDAGCGAGLACEPLARLGAKVTGTDMGKPLIDAAQAHASAQQLDIQYLAGPVESVTGQYDVVMSLEVVEHVDSPADFITQCISKLKPEGLLILSTLNRTAKSFALGIIAAEHILKWVPKGTHEWSKFLKPSELANIIRHNGLNVQNIDGLVYNPITRKFSIHPNDIDVNYFITASA